MSNTENDDAATLEWIENHVKDAIPEFLLYPEVEPLEEELQEDLGEDILIPDPDAPDAPKPASYKVKRFVYGSCACLILGFVIGGFLSAISH